MIGEPDAGNLHVRFDEGTQETDGFVPRLRPTLRNPRVSELPLLYSCHECVLSLRSQADVSSASHLSAFMRHEHLRPGCRNQTKGLSKMANLTPRLPVHGRRHPSLIRLAIGFPFGQYPPTGFGQVAGDRYGRFTVSFSSPQPLI